MWAVAAQHKKYNDSISGYNSLKDPHLNSYFRKPQIRKHLLRANIINKDNKIVEEITSTKHLQRIERKQKKELYHLLEELVKRNDQLDGKKQLALLPNSGGRRKVAEPLPASAQEELIKHAKIMFDGSHGLMRSKSGPLSSDEERSGILHRLDRMIRAIKEYDHIVALEQSQLEASNPNRNTNATAAAADRVWLSKSYQDISGNASSPRFDAYQLKSCASSGQLSRERRPKSSYGRQRHFLNTSSPDLPQATNETNELEDTMKKSKSCVNIVDCSVDGQMKDSLVANEEDIESVEGDSWSDTCPESDHGYSGSRAQSKSSSENASNGKYCTMDKKMVKSLARQRVKMTLKYNGLNGATNRGAKRNVKVFQQVAIGGNSILIYDGYVVAGDVFTFDIRPHPNTSFAIIILVNGIRDLRLNTCCEHKHRPGTKLSHFTFVDVVGGRPCFACQSTYFDSEKVAVNKYFDWFATNIENNKTTESIDSDYIPAKKSNDSEVVEDKHDMLDETNENDIKVNFPTNDQLQNEEQTEPNNVDTLVNLPSDRDKLSEPEIDNVDGDETIELIIGEVNHSELEEKIINTSTNTISSELAENEKEEQPEELHLKPYEDINGNSSDSNSSLTGQTVIANENGGEDVINVIDHNYYISEETLPEMDIDSDSDTMSAVDTEEALKLKE